MRFSVGDYRELHNRIDHSVHSGEVTTFYDGNDSWTAEQRVGDFPVNSKQNLAKTSQEFLACMERSMINLILHVHCITYTMPGYRFSNRLDVAAARRISASFFSSVPTELL